MKRADFIEGEQFWCADGEWVRWEDVEERIAALEEERDALRKDAERYRLIRPASFVRQFNVVDGDLTPLNDSELDAAIDDAIAAKESQ